MNKHVMLLRAVFCPSLYTMALKVIRLSQKRQGGLRCSQHSSQAGALKASHPSAAETGGKTKQRRERLGSRLRESLHTTELQHVFDHLCDSLFCSYINVHTLLCKICSINVYFTR